MGLRSLFSLFSRAPRENAQSRQKAMAAFRRRYISFKTLLQSNADLASILAKLTRAQQGEIGMETSQVRKQARRSILLCQRMARALNDISGNHYPELEEACGKIGQRVEKELRRHVAGDLRAITLPLSEIDASMAYMVGGKSANMGEMRNILGLPTPRGFAVSIKAGTIFLLRNGDLFQNIYAHLSKVDVEKPHTIRASAAAIARLIENAPMPAALAEPVLKAWDETFGKASEKAIAAVRSSAVAEDGAQSFAGQYLTVLGVRRSTLLEACRKVIGSLFCERALAYRAAHGYALDATGMGLCCLEMVEAKASGVAFSRHPVDLRSSNALINGAWGLGEMVVDGIGAADQWAVSRGAEKIRQSLIAHKTSRQILARENGEISTRIVDMPEDLADVPSLSDEQVKKLAQMALALERHYQYPQDVEWAVDQDDQIVLLQTRPLELDLACQDMCAIEEAMHGLGHLRPLLCGGDIAARGVGCGPVAHVRPNQELAHFPEGAVLVTENSSPNMMSALRKAGAVVAETGSVTGHMASLCREFNIPAILNLRGAADVLKEGEIVTVDALSGRIFPGEVLELLSLRLGPRKKPLADTPALTLLRHVAPLILPLRLIDPQSEMFSAANCASIHDIMRYAHEKSYVEMFRISDSLSESGVEGVASKLVCPIPLDLYVIDLGGGLKNPHLPRVSPEDVLSAPFASLLAGMLNPEVQARGPRPVNMRGFLSVMGQSMIGGNLHAGERFGDRSYAIISDKYLNFSSRVGYHYAVLDSWAGDTINKNYVRFEFAGGAAGDEQRARRARCIGLILSELGFTVDVSHDRIRARFQKYPKLEIRSRLDQVGRLLIVSRQMDMLMVSENSVREFAERFLAGEYH